ncbi:hypothetical protein [[Phormidium] sp. ETS-05]|uniref:hypothetical protein n=1 Tax=[Phormidium] sp. ETS-05 TaxID=222819 RepID=UPI0018EEE22E|nr:hypothetical protein [[Phormidium] sp. ETS-05]
MPIIVCPNLGKWAGLVAGPLALMAVFAPLMLGSHLECGGGTGRSLTFSLLLA